MPRALVTGNHAAGYALAVAGQANRAARGCAGGAYPITPQTEIIEFLRGFEFEKGRIVAVESEHSAMGVCIGAALAGARTLTASSSNGLAYMTENVFAAGYYRLPIVMVAVNRTLGPPWNIWVDQGDSLALRDAAWMQFYVESHQELVDTILLAFRVAEDRRVLLPAIVAMDGFVLSHTQMGVDLPEQAAVDRFLPPLELPHRLRPDHPATVGGLTWPRETEHHRREIQEAMERIPTVLAEAIREFEAIFGRRPHAALTTEHTADAEAILITSGTMTRTARRVVEARRRDGQRVGLIGMKMFRPFPREELRAAVAGEVGGPGAARIGVLDRNHSPGSGGIFWQEIAATLAQRAAESQRVPLAACLPVSESQRVPLAACLPVATTGGQAARGARGTHPISTAPLVQDYLVGLGGGDVTPAVIDELLDDLVTREIASPPVWKEVAA